MAMVIPLSATSAKTSTRSDLRRNAACILMAAVCAVFMSACDESLPPRNNPTQPIVATCEVDYYSPSREEAVYFTMKVRNNYTEVFSDVANIFGYINFVWAERPEYTRQIVFSLADLRTTYFNPQTGQQVVSKAVYNAATKTLTIPVGDYAVFQYKWDSKFDSLSDLREMVGFKTDPANPGILVSREIALTVTGGARLFKKLPMVYLQPLTGRYKYRRAASEK